MNDDDLKNDKSVDDKANENIPEKIDANKNVKRFLTSFIGMLFIPLFCLLISALNSESYIFLAPMLLSIPLAILGFILWAKFREKEKALALGFLFGGALPFAILFLYTGGCGLFYF